MNAAESHHSSMSLHSFLLPQPGAALQRAFPHFFEGSLAQTRANGSEQPLPKTSPLRNQPFQRYCPKRDLQALPAVFSHMRSDGVCGCA